MKWSCEGLLAAEFGHQTFNVSEYMPTVTPLFIVKHSLSSFATKIRERFRRKKSKNEMKGYSNGNDAGTMLSIEEAEWKDGDRVLNSLGVPNASYQGASNKLGQMLIIHVSLALIGLIFGKRPE